MEESKHEKDKAKEKQRMKLLLKEMGKAEKRGVCYLSRIPPRLTPLKLRHLLSQYGEILRIYLAPQDPALRLHTKTGRKNRGQKFTEGWVEFAKRSVAKRVAKMLNGEPMGGKRRSAHYYDLWNMKYLRKFKWDNLTEEIAYKNAVREQRLAMEISAAKRERDFYLSKVDQAKAISAMEERKKKKQKFDEGSMIDQQRSSETAEGHPQKIVRKFAQRELIKGSDLSTSSRLSKDILTGVFGKSN